MSGEEGRSHGFTQVGNVIVDATWLSDGALRLYLMIRSWTSNGSGSCTKSSRWLIKRLGCGRTRFFRHLDELEKNGLLIIDHGTRGHGNTYHVTDNLPKTAPEKTPPKKRMNATGGTTVGTMVVLPSVPLIEKKTDKSGTTVGTTGGTTVGTMVVLPSVPKVVPTSGLYLKKERKIKENKETPLPPFASAPAFGIFNEDDFKIADAVFDEDSASPFSDDLDEKFTNEISEDEIILVGVTPTTTDTHASPLPAGDGDALDREIQDMPPDHPVTIPERKSSVRAINGFHPVPLPPPLAAAVESIERATEKKTIPDKKKPTVSGKGATNPNQPYFTAMQSLLGMKMGDVPREWYSYAGIVAKRLILLGSGPEDLPELFDLHHQQYAYRYKNDPGHPTDLADLPGLVSRMRNQKRVKVGELDKYDQQPGESDAEFYERSGYHLSEAEERESEARRRERKT